MAPLRARSLAPFRLNWPERLRLLRQLSRRPPSLQLHLFAGRRRAEDFHESLVALAAGPDSPHKLVLLSLDTAVHRSLDFFGYLEIGGAVAGGGPGGHEFGSAQTKPRPLRTAQRPWSWSLAQRGLGATALEAGSFYAMQTAWIMQRLAVTGDRHCD